MLLLPRRLFLLGLSLKVLHAALVQLELILAIWCIPFRTLSILLRISGRELIWNLSLKSIEVLNVLLVVFLLLLWVFGELVKKGRLRNLITSLKRPEVCNRLHRLGRVHWLQRLL